MCKIDFFLGQFATRITSWKIENCGWDCELCVIASGMQQDFEEIEVYVSSAFFSHL